MEMAQPLRLLGIAGSLRRGSHNRALLAALGDVLPDGARLTLFELAEVPLYDADVEARGLPKSVIALRQAIGEADGMVIATPEYNAGVPGVLKNALDWASRPPSPRPLLGKPVGILGATPGKGNTAAAQSQLRETLVATGAACMPAPTVRLSQVAPLFDAAGTLTDEPTRALLTQYAAALHRWVARFATS
jgi:chromate reductase